MLKHRTILSLGLLLALVVGAALAGQPGVVLLRNGEVFQGQIEPGGDELRLLLPNGEVRFRNADVESVAATTGELYLSRRAAVLPDDAQAHLRLAQWCIRQGLFDGAAAEIDAARTIDPRNPSIGLMARRLELGRQPPATPKPAAAAPRGPNNLEELDRLVHGLPDKSVENFTLRVQPTVMNSCATAACHGAASPSKLQLLRAGSGRPASRRLTQRNLQSLLPWIDQQNPADSPLLKYSATLHAAGKAPPLARDSVQYRRLMEWVYQVARADDRLPPAKPETKLAEQAKRVEPADRGVVLTGGTEPKGSGKVHRSGVVHAGGAAPAGSSPGSPAVTVPEAAVLAAPAAAPAAAQPAAGADPFDPEVFNRRFLQK